MGRAYAKDLAELSDTYGWAHAVDLGALEAFVGEAIARPLLAIGSGGSSTAAHLAALLHRYRARACAHHATPLDSLLGEPNLREAVVLLISASGKNRDVLAALKYCVQCDTRAVATLCTRRGSPLARAARHFERAYVFEDDIPAGRDGFLATNSLLATCVLVARAYGSHLPEYLVTDAVMPTVDGVDVDDRSTAVILHGGWGAPVATDLESKLNESAILSAQVSDYRNFGHGRHFWLARRAPQTIVIEIVTPETAGVAERTRALLPPDIPIVELRTEYQGAAATIDLLIQGFHLVGRLGQLQGFDPGRPSVPEFGRKLYHLAPLVPLEAQPLPVVRKLARLALLAPDRQAEVLSALGEFIEGLSATRLGGLVLDYDGTLCASQERFGVLRDDIADEFRRLLEGGLIIGIATGRGRSVRQSLQTTLPRSLWDRVIIGYYNGGDIAPLVRDDVPSRDALAEPPLDVAKDLLERDPLLHDLVSLTPRRRQITVEPKGRISTGALMSHVMTVLAPLEKQGVRVLESTHSVDVLPPGVGKLDVVDDVKQRIRRDSQVLCIGDRGAWPGNDCALLSHEPSLSVDEVSASLTTCWNLAPSGVTGADATLQYLKAIRVSDGIATLNARDLWRRA